MLQIPSLSQGSPLPQLLPATRELAVQPAKALPHNDPATSSREQEMMQLQVMQAQMEREASQLSQQMQFVEMRVSQLSSVEPPSAMQVASPPILPTAGPVGQPMFSPVLPQWSSPP